MLNKGGRSCVRRSINISNFWRQRDTAHHLSSLAHHDAARTSSAARMKEAIETLMRPLPVRADYSTVPGGGLGLFADSAIKRGSIVSFYPGTVWRVDDLTIAIPVDEFAPPVPTFTINNAYLARARTFEDGRWLDLTIDGRPFGLSADIFRSAAARLEVQQRPDTRWLEDNVCRSDEERLGMELPPLAHLINCSCLSPNVWADDPILIDETELPPHVLRCMPVAAAASLEASFRTLDRLFGRDERAQRWLFPYRALVDIREGEELFWDYGQEPLAVGWH